MSTNIQNFTHVKWNSLFLHMCDVAVHSASFFGSSNCLQPRWPHYFWRKILQKTWMCFGGVSIILYRNRVWILNKRCQAKCTKYWNFHIIETAALITTKFCTTIKTTKYYSWVVQICPKQIKHGRWPPPKKFKNCIISTMDWPILMKFETECWHRHCKLCLGHNDWAFFDSNLAVNYTLRLAVGNPDCHHNIVPLQHAVRRDFWHVTTVTFLHISRKPPLRSWTWLYHLKANEKMFPMTHCPYGNIVNFSHTSQIHFCWTMRHSWGRKFPETSQTPLPLAARQPSSNTPMPGPSTLNTSNNSSISSCTAHNYATKSPFITMGQCKSPPKLPLPLQRSPPHLIHPSLDWPHSPSQTVSRANQPFCHSKLFRSTDRQTVQTHRPTDGLGNRSVR